MALHLVGAFHHHHEIRPSLPEPKGPGVHVFQSIDSVVSSDVIAQHAHLILHVDKSRDTDQGWVIIQDCSPDFIKSLPPTIMVEQHSLHKTLGDLKHAQEQVTELQKRGTKLKDELEKLKNPPVPMFVKWWINFDEQTRQNLYILLGRDRENRSKNGANFSAQAILEWMAKDLPTQGWDRYMAAEEWKKELCHKRDLCELQGKQLHDLQMENIKLQDLQIKNAELEEKLRKAKRDNPDIKDILHPTGRCTCTGEGKCLWCTMDTYRQSASERLEEITKLKLDKEDLEKRVAELKATTGLQYLDELEKLKKDVLRLRKHEQKKKCCECNTRYPIHEDMVCGECIAKKFQVQCTECGDNLNALEAAYCDDCHEDTVNRLQESRVRVDELETALEKFKKDWVDLGKDKDDWKERYKTLEATSEFNIGLLQDKSEELEIAFKKVTLLEQLLGKAVVDLNAAGAPKSPWREKYEKLHEKYLHQTSTGKDVDLGEELYRMKVARNALETQKLRLEREEESTAIRMYDEFAEQIIDALTPTHYDAKTDDAQGGADVEQILQTISGLVHRCGKADEGDFKDKVHHLLSKGKSDAEIAELFGADENDEVEMLVALVRKQWGDEPRKLNELKFYCEAYCNKTFTSTEPKTVDGPECLFCNRVNSVEEKK